MHQTEQQPMNCQFHMRKRCRCSSIVSRVAITNIYCKRICSLHKDSKTDLNLVISIGSPPFARSPMLWTVHIKHHGLGSSVFCISEPHHLRTNYATNTLFLAYWCAMQICTCSPGGGRCRRRWSPQEGPYCRPRWTRDAPLSWRAWNITGNFQYVTLLEVRNTTISPTNFTTNFTSSKSDKRIMYMHCGIWNHFAIVFSTLHIHTAYIFMAPVMCKKLVVRSLLVWTQCAASTHILSIHVHMLKIYT